MTSKRWWDVAVIAGSLVIAAALTFGFRPEGTWRYVLGLGAIALFALAYAFVARPALGGPAGTAAPDAASGAWRFPLFIGLTAVALGAGAAAAGFLAILQALAYPLAWVIGDSRRRGVIASAVLALAVALGLSATDGFGVAGITAGLLTGVFSFAFSAAFGLWITSIAEYGEERARLLAELTGAQAEVEALSAERGAALERERLSRDIHDTLAQTLAGLVMLAERAGRQSRAGETDAAATTIGTVERVARDALGEARALVARNAAVPQETAFEAALERLVERFRLPEGPRVVLEVDLAGEQIERDAQVVLLRCLQEGLSNASRHAAAAVVEVRVGVDDAGIRLEVRDDGRGFDADSRPGGFGIDGMRERVALAHGALDVVSAPGEGTTLSVRLPAPEGTTAPAPTAEATA